MGRVVSNFEKIITRTTMIGTARNMPVAPQIAPQTTSDRRITKVERLSWSPISRGTMTLPAMNWITPSMAAISRTVPGSPVIRVAKAVGTATPSSEPMVGM